MTAELLRLRDCATGHRLIVKDAAEHYGVRLSVAAGDTISLGATLDLFDLEVLISELTKAADRHRRELCPWCDSLGMIDGLDGPEFCTHEITGNLAVLPPPQKSEDDRAES